MAVTLSKYGFHVNVFLVIFKIFGGTADRNTFYSLVLHAFQSWAGTKWETRLLFQFASLSKPDICQNPKSKNVTIYLKYYNNGEITMKQMSTDEKQVFLVQQRKESDHEYKNLQIKKGEIKCILS